MFAMWLAGRIFAVLLALLTTAGMLCAPVHAAPPSWGGCAQFLGDAPVITTAQCTTIAVPIDRANPEGAQAQLAVIRIPAAGDRIGTLMVNPGGPGASAVDTVAQMGTALAGTQIAGRFDLV